MSQALFARLEPIIAEALTLEAAERTAFLDLTCAGDLSLRREVEALVSLNGEAQAFLERPALEEAARALHDEAALDSLVGRQLGAYRIDGLVGIGGMGEVYRAHDAQLARDVALKVLAPAPGRAEDRAPVMLEARAAARLNHPNIVTVHAVGHADGLDFIAMELVSGQTLRERLQQGSLRPADTIELAMQLAEALGAAHAAGIVHRDLKPENVMVTPSGLLKVLDFGIAVRGHDGDELAAGTAGYMSPEQAAGQPAHPASDLFSFGAILYEMLAGQPPFAGASRDEVLTAVRSAAFVPIERAAPGAPPALSAVVSRCLALLPADRPANANELLAALRSCRPAEGAIPARRRVALGLAAAAAATVTGVAVWRRTTATAHRRTIAVLPFRNLSEDPDADYLADGLSATLIDRVASMPSLSVLPRSLVFNFRQATGDAGSVGRQLGADIVLGGTVLRRGDGLTVRAELQDASAGRSLWTGTFENRVTELLLVEEQIATAIMERGVGTQLDAQQRRRLARRPTTDARAYDLYLRAVHLCQLEDESAYLEARALLGEALARDPLFGAGHVQMATTYAVMAVDGLERPTDAWPESSRHVRSALDAEPDLPDAHACSAAQEFFFNWSWDGAEAEWRQAMRYGVSDLHPDLHAARALERWALGHIDEALALIRRARRLDPVTPMFAIREADYVLQAGDADAAATLYMSVLAADPGDARALSGLSDTRRRQGRFAEALDARRRAHAAAGETEMTSDLGSTDAAQALRRLDTRSAQAELRLLQARARVGAYVSPIDLARQHARLGQADAAAGWFARALADRAPGLVMLNVDGAWDGMRADPRLDAVRTRVGLTTIERSKT